MFRALVLVLALAAVAAGGCGSSGSGGSSIGDGGADTGTDPGPGCDAVLSSSRDAATWADRDAEILLLFPPEGAVVLPPAPFTPEILVSGRFFGDAAGGVTVNGVAAEVWGNAFGVRLADPGEVTELAIEVEQRDGAGDVVATASRTVGIGASGPTAHAINVVPTPFIPPADRQTFRDLVARDCSDDVVFLITFADTSHQEALETLAGHGVETLGSLSSGTRPAVATRADFEALDDAVLEELGVVWLGATVPQQKHQVGFDWSVYDETDPAALAPGDSIAGLPAVVLGGVGLWPTWSQASLGLVEAVAPWTSKMSDEYIEAILALDELRWLLQEPMIRWVEPIGVDCPDCEGCPCDMSPCATRAPLCPVLFGEDSACETDVCTG